MHVAEQDGANNTNKRTQFDELAVLQKNQPSRFQLRLVDRMRSGPELISKESLVSFLRTSALIVAARSGVFIMGPSKD